MYRFARQYCGPVRLVVIDLAGTTVDYGSLAPLGVFLELFNKRGVRPTIAEAREPMGMHKRRHILTMARMPAVAAQWRERFGRDATDTDIDAMYDEFVPLQLEAIRRHNDLIPGTLEAVAQMREAGIAVAATTGYTADMLKIVLDGARENGYEPDLALCASDVPRGRPEPWMIYRSMEQLNVFPPEAVVKIGDTIQDIESGLNAGCWSVGTVRSGNMLGLSREDDEALDDDERERRLDVGRAAMLRAGAHYAVDMIGDCLAVIQEINERLIAGDKP